MAILLKYFTIAFS